MQYSVTWSQFVSWAARIVRACFGWPLLAAAAGFWLAPAALAQVSFAPRTTYATGQDPYDVALGDLNNDGTPDVVTVATGDGLLTVQRGRGDGTFLPATTYNLPVGSSSVVIGDFNRDGKPDLAVGNGTTNNVTILTGNGNGTFTIGASYAAGTNPYVRAAVDFNADGRADLIIANYNASAITILYATNTNGFGAPITYSSGSHPLDLVVADLNNDGKPDIAAGYDFGTAVAVFLNNGNGLVAPAFYAAGTGARGIVAGDFNHDGRVDLAVANYAGSNTVNVLLGTGGGAFGAATAYPAGLGPWSLTTGDFNGDGQTDLAVADYSGGGVSILPGSATGAFGAPVFFSTGSLTIALAAADIDRDGWTDIAVANYGLSAGQDTLAILRNTRALCNNFCSSPSPVFNNTPMSFSTFGATTDGPAESRLGFCCGDIQVNQDVWFLYTADCTGTASVDLCGSDFNTKVAIYAGTTCPTSRDQAIAGNDDSTRCSGNRSFATFPCAAGNQYLIRVGGFSTGAGNAQMIVTCTDSGACDPDFNHDGNADQGDVDSLIDVIAGGDCP